MRCIGNRFFHLFSILTMAKNPETTDANTTMKELCRLIGETIDNTNDWNALLTLRHYTDNVVVKISHKMHEVLSTYLEPTGLVNGQSVQVYREYSKPKKFYATIVRSTIVNVNTEGQVVTDKEIGMPEIGLLVIKNDTEQTLRVRMSEIVQH